MATADAILDAEAVLRAARVPVTELARGDRVVLHTALPGSVVCTESVITTVLSTLNLHPTRIHPPAWWEVTTITDAGGRHDFNCSALFTVLRASEGA